MNREQKTDDRKPQDEIIELLKSFIQHRAQERKSANLMLDGRVVSTGEAHVQNGTGQFYPIDGSTLRGFPENGNILLLLDNEQLYHLKNFVKCSSEETHSHFSAFRR